MRSIWRCASNNSPDSSRRWLSVRSSVARTSRSVRIDVRGVRSSWAETRAKSRADSNASSVRLRSLSMRLSMLWIASDSSSASRVPRTDGARRESPSTSRLLPIELVVSVNCCSGRTLGR